MICEFVEYHLVRFYHQNPVKTTPTQFNFSSISTQLNLIPPIQLNPNLSDQKAYDNKCCRLVTFKLNIIPTFNKKVQFCLISAILVNLANFIRWRGNFQNCPFLTTPTTPYFNSTSTTTSQIDKFGCNKVMVLVCCQLSVKM